MPRTRIPVALAAAAVILSGCSQRIGDFTLISTKNVDIGGKYRKLEQRYTGEDVKMTILTIPIGVPDLKQAVDNCIEAGKGELLSNAVVESSFWTVILYGEMKYVVKGDVWVRASTSAVPDGSAELYDLVPGPGGYRLVSVADPSKSVKVDYFVSR